MTYRLLLAIVFVTQLVTAQVQTPPAVQSPEILPDGKVTFRLLDPGAKAVMLYFEGDKPVAHDAR